ncbi:MAG: gliding motility-associated C-terminal domain-containing protein [Nonlabens sp.]|uniref:T9SS type B sorting domain-containing protein n=1 Tax=Nonlabens sp. TaxID=1888209 RepID=UPI003EF8D855
MKFLVSLLLFFISITTCYGQTTDLAITVEAQDFAGSPISQAHFYERYSYLITISNTGAPVVNADFNLSLSSVNNIESAVAQNNLGGAVSPSTINIVSNTVSGILPNMPNSSSFEILVTVRASPIFLGGATATAVVNPPAGTTDTNLSTNSSVISIIMTERPIDFQISQTQIIPAGNGSLASWGDSVTYEITITNNSGIEYPLQNFSIAARNVNSAGSTLVTLENFSCINSNGMNCPTLVATNPMIAENLTGQFEYYNHSQVVVFPAGASFTLRATYKVEEGDCSRRNPNVPLIIGNSVIIDTYINNTNFLENNSISTTALLNTPCPCTDLTSQVTKVSPIAGTLNAWTDIVTYDFTFTNNGPLDIIGGAYLINTSNLNTGVEVLTATCTGTTGTLNCSDINIVIAPDFRWLTDDFVFPANSSATVRTTVRFIPPECTTGGVAPVCSMRGIVFENDPALIDCDLTNDFNGAAIVGLPVTPCVDIPNDPIITLTEIQTIPAPGAGPYPYGDITYEIVMSNLDTIPHHVKFRDRQFSTGTGILQSIICTGTTGGATCPTVLNENIGVVNVAGDTFWEILDTDNFIMPASSSITYEKVVNWKPECSVMVVNVQDDLGLQALDSSLATIASASASVATPMVPCVDLVVQTYPSVTSAPINAPLEWVIDITNSNISVDASNITFTDLMHPDFTITGSPTCTLITGNATCISSFNVTGNQTDAIIPFMESGATIQVRIPITSPTYGGSFENRAEAQPDFTQQGENTPDSNISTSSLFVLTTQTAKSFEPSIINTGETSILTFTLTNSVGLPAQSNISFTDNLPPEITLTGNATWVNQNGASGAFIDTIGSNTIGIQNLSFPAGTQEISFSVEVTSSVPGFYVNDFQNFTNLNNIDVSTAFATLEVLPILDLNIIKTVNEFNPDVNGSVTFTIIVENLGTAIATDVVVEEFLPSGYNYISHTETAGTFDNSSGLWLLGDMNPGDSASLEITVSFNLPGDFINIVNVYSGNALDDVNLENNSSQAFTRPDCLKIPEGFSPNNDGVNDTFEIECIELYPDSELKIFNRHGSIVYEATGYHNDWNGIPNRGILHNSSELLPVGTYFWHLDLKDGSPARVSWVYINY